MTSVNEQIQNADSAICRNIELLADQRGLLSQNVLAQIRNLVEGVSVRLYKNSPNADFNYSDVSHSLDFVKSRAKYNFLNRFHNLIQKSSSHFTLDGDTSERLMLKYYEYLFRVRKLLRDECSISALRNLEDFPVKLDPSLKEYHEKIAAKIDEVSSLTSESTPKNRYYIHKTRPFFVSGKIYYEVTLYRAVNNVSKSDRIIAFTNIDMTDKYSSMLILRRSSIRVLDQTMPISIILHWEVSIRPCEFNNFARILGISVDVKSSSTEYIFLMQRLTVSSGNLNDVIDMPDNMYSKMKLDGTAKITKPQIFQILDEVRRIVKAAAPGYIVLKYLILRMHNQIIKPLYDFQGCPNLSNLKLRFSSIPFDIMPFCTSLPRHNPRFSDLIESIDLTNRIHELLVRRVRNNVEQKGILYTPDTELDEFGDIDSLIALYNRKIYYKHLETRKVIHDKKHVFILGYENDTVSIINMLKEFSLSGISGYRNAVERWLDEKPSRIEDPAKINVLKQLFDDSRLALIYGAAGTGKSTMVDHIAHFFHDKKKLFLAHTNPAIDNLKRKVTAQNSEFRTISSQIGRRSSEEYDLLVIDECSTVSNSEFIKVLNKTSFKLIVLVGDIYQIESIQFGNWFGMIRSFIPSSSVFELTTPYRTKNASLLSFWNKVRKIEDDLAEVIAKNGYSTSLDKSIFDAQGNDEIILCLNYDGLYGINNINRFLQSSNPKPAVIWRDSTYKVGDPILFNETERFRPMIYNNLKGRIMGVDLFQDRIRFDIELDRPISEFDIIGDELEWMGESTVRFSVYESETSDEDDDSLNTSVPFQVAYAVSIHKAQGLEYDSVKIVITDDNEDQITHSIFYTAITRARKKLRIFWTPEAQQSILQRLRHTADPKDIYILSSRRGLTPVNKQLN